VVELFQAKHSQREVIPAKGNGVRMAGIRNMKNEESIGVGVGRLEGS
jgi:hypothetical protein